MALPACGEDLGLGRLLQDVGRCYVSRVDKKIVLRSQAGSWKKKKIWDMILPEKNREKQGRFDKRGGNRQ